MSKWTCLLPQTIHKNHYVHSKKSVLIPSHKFAYLLLIMDSENMAVVATDEKKQKLTRTAAK